MLQIKNPELDFIFKSLFLFLVPPLVFVFLFSLALSYFGADLWEYDGYFAFYILNLLGSYLIYFLGILLSLILIAIFNKKYMSGEGIKFWPKVGLVLLALISNWVILFVLGKLFL